MNTKGERINFLRKKNDKSYNDLALVVGNIKADGMRKAIVDDFISDRQIAIICEKLGWDQNWILYGGEEPKTIIVNEPSEDYKINKNHFKPVPFYNLNVSAGDIVFMDNGLLENQQPDDFMYIPKNIDADVAFPTYGHSMYPEISNGDKVAYKFIKDWSFFNYGMKYLVVTAEQRMVKYIKRNSKEGYITLESRNEDYDPIDMPISSIKAILQVRYIGKIEM
jgi:hypothetical protein